jgi:hypothetical protein
LAGNTDRHGGQAEWSAGQTGFQVQDIYELKKKRENKQLLKERKRRVHWKGMWCPLYNQRWNS